MVLTLTPTDANDAFTAFLRDSNITSQSMSFLSNIWNYFSEAFKLGGISGIVSFVIVVAIAYFALTKVLNLSKTLALIISVILAVVSAGFVVAVIYGFVKGFMGV